MHAKLENPSFARAAALLFTWCVLAGCAGDPETAAAASAAEPPGATPETAPNEIDEETKEALQALGYLGGD